MKDIFFYELSKRKALPWTILTINDSDKAEVVAQCADMEDAQLFVAALRNQERKRDAKSSGS